MTPVNAGWTNPQTIQDVRPKVRELLLAVPSFAQLSPAERSELAGNMVKVLSYIENPGGIVGDGAGTAGPARSGASPLVRAQKEDAVETTKESLAQSPGMVGQDFKAGAVREGVEQFGALVQKVDFPKFVGGLIKNVFQAIVESSIEQMRAYGELIANVAKTVDQFMGDNISPGAGRDWLAQRYPGTLDVEISKGDAGFAEGTPASPTTATLVAKGDDAPQK